MHSKYTTLWQKAQFAWSNQVLSYPYIYCSLLVRLNQIIHDLRSFSSRWNFGGCLNANTKILISSDRFQIKIYGQFAFCGNINVWLISLLLELQAKSVSSVSVSWAIVYGFIGGFRGRWFAGGSPWSSLVHHDTPVSELLFCILGPYTYVYWTPLRAFQANLQWNLYTYIKTINDYNKFVQKF